MSIKEVADAYIEIHGDLSPFRRDLRKAAQGFKKDGEVAGQAYVDGMTSRAESEFSKKWGKLLDAVYSGDKLDWDRLFGEFDSDNIDDAGDKIDEFLKTVRSAGLLGREQFEELTKTVQNNTEVFSTAANMQEIMRREVDEARLAADRYSKSLAGLRDAAQFDDMERTLKGIAEATKGLDFGPTMDANYAKMVKAAGGFEQFATQVDKTLKVARELGRVTEEETDAIVRSVDRYIDAEKKRELSILATKDAAKVATDQMKAFEKSFEAREMRMSLAAINKDMDALATAVKTQNWSGFAKGHKTIDSMRDRLKDLLTHFRGTAEMSEESARRVEASFNRMASNPKKFGVELEQTARKFRPIHFAMDKLHTSWVRMDSTVRLVLGLIAAAAGPMATLGSGLAGSITAVVSSLANSVGAIVPLAAGFAGIGVSIGLAVSAWDGMIARVPVLQTALDGIAATWRAQAEDFGRAWEGSLRDLLVNFRRELAGYDFGTPLGEAFAGISERFTEIVNGPAFSAFMTALTTDIPTAVQGLGTGFANMMNVLLGMLAAAAPTAAALGDDFAKWSQGLSDSLTSAEGMSQMSDTFARMRESLLVVLDLAGSIGMALGTMFGIGADSGDRLLTSLTGVVDKFTAWMNTDAGRQAMIDWFANAETIIKSLEPLLVAIGEALAGLVTPASIAQFQNLMIEMGAFVDVLGQILGAISQMGLLNVLFAGLNMLGAAIAPLLPALGEVGRLIGETLVGAFHNLTPLFAAIGGAIAPFIAGMAQIWTVVGPAVVDAFGRITTALTPVFEVLGQLVAFIMGILAPALGPFIVGIINSFVGVIEGISNIIMGVVNIVRGIFAGDWPMIWNGIVQVVSGVVQAVWELINLWIVGKLVGGVRAAISGVSGIFKTGWQGIQSFFSGIMTKLGTVASSGFNAIKTWVSNAVSATRATFSAGWNAIRSFFTSAVNGIRSTATSVFNSIRSFISTIINSIRSVFTAGWNAIRSSVTSVVNSIRSVISSGFNAARSVVSSAVNSIRSFVSSAFNTARSLVSSAMSAIRSAVSSGISNVLSFFGSLGGRIVGAISGVAGQLAGVGRNMISGLIGGIRDMAGAAMSAARGVVDGAISAAKNLLGIKSPSRVFMNFGHMTGEGFVMGLEDEGTHVRSAAERMIDAVTAPFADKSLRGVGKLAAESLATGFNSGRGVLDHAMEFAASGPPRTSRGTAIDSVQTVGGTTVVFEAGAVQTHTNVADPELVAESTMDNLVAVASRM